MVLVSAPTGHGKTAAVADWVRATPEVATSWVSLDESERDEIAWWRSVLAALRARDGVPEDSALHRLEFAFPDRGSWVREAFVATLLEALEELPGPGRLVLDDAHEIVGHPAERALRALVRSAVPGLTIVVCSRFDPPIGLDRLRLQGRLGELRVDRLAFTLADATRLFEHASLGLSPGQTLTLVERTEGWVAALCLVALSLQSEPDPSSAVADFAGDDRSVADYVVDEVLAKLDERERRVVEACSALSPVPVELVGVLTGDDGVAAVLEHLEVVTGMVRATDRHGERYQAHELLRSHVLARLRRGGGDRLRGMYQRASTWFDAHDDAASAVQFAVLAGDVPGVETLLRARAVELLADGGFASLRGLDHLLRTRDVDTGTRVVLALAAVERGEVEHAAALLADVPTDQDDQDDQDDAVLRGIAMTRLALARGRQREAWETAKAITLDGITPDAAGGAPLRALALVTRGYAAATAEPLRARADAQEALELARDRDWPSATAQARAALAFSHVHGERLDLAVEHAHAVLDLAAQHGWTDTPWPAGALVVLAVSDLLGGNPGQALAGVTRAEGVACVHHAEYRNTLATVRGAAEYDSGRLNEGWQLLRTARRQALAEDLDDQHVAFIALLEQQAALHLGRTQGATEIVKAVGSRLDGTSECILLEARQRWASTRDPGTRRVLGPALDGSHHFLTSVGEADALVLDAEIALAAGHQQLVRHRVRQALQHANDHGTQRPLLKASPALHDYLEERRGTFGALDHAVTWVLARAAPPTSSPATALTEREQDVLELLPTLQPVDEIAKDLGGLPQHRQDPHASHLPEARRRRPARRRASGAPCRPAHRLRTSGRGPGGPAHMTDLQIATIAPMPLSGSF